MKYVKPGRAALVAYNGYGDTLVIATNNEELDAAVQDGDDNLVPLPKGGGLEPGVYVVKFDAVCEGDYQLEVANAQWSKANAAQVEAMRKMEPPSYSGGEEESKVLEADDRKRQEALDLWNSIPTSKDLPEADWDKYD